MIIVDIRGCLDGYQLWLMTPFGEHILPGRYTTLTAAARMASRVREAIR